MVILYMIHMVDLSIVMWYQSGFHHKDTSCERFHHGLTLHEAAGNSPFVNTITIYGNFPLVHG